MRSFGSLAALVTLATIGRTQATWHVPVDHPTISAAIAAAQDGDTILVAPGTYLEMLNFAGKRIAVRSTSGPQFTTVNAGGAGSVVRFESGESRDTLLEGFTITGGVIHDKGGGIRVLGSSPTIRDCIVFDNRAVYNDGGGIYVSGGGPLIQNCIVRNNIVTFDASGILVAGGSTEWTVIMNCVVYRNHSYETDLMGAVGSYPGAKLLVINTISRDNIASDPYDVPAPGVVMHSNGNYGVPPGNGNSTANPLWVNPAAGDFRLESGSPCRDAGSAGLPALPGLVASFPFSDLFGGPRIAGARPDKGVHEFQLVDAYFCRGDGSAAPCPCGNGGQVHRGCANGSGDGALLTASGSTSLASADLVLHADNMLPSNPGLFFQGTNQVAGGAGIAFGDGLRCAGGTVKRIQVRISGFDSKAATTLDIGAKGGALAGQTLHYQIWYRDTFTTTCGWYFNTSNGLSLTWQP